MTPKERVEINVWVYERQERSLTHTVLSTSDLCEEIPEEESGQLERELFDETTRSRVNLSRDVPLSGISIEYFLGGEPSLLRTSAIAGVTTLVLGGAKAIAYISDSNGRKNRKLRSKVTDGDNLYSSRLEYAWRKSREEAMTDVMMKEMIQGNPFAAFLEIFSMPSRFIDNLRKFEEKTTPLLDYAAENPNMRFIGYSPTPTSTPLQ